ncbi:MAG TPA: S41 family peptidase [Acetobacteraceae bacterium]|nr:S41 family peptidase [Acetobacteraceae bacterium]
MIRIGALFVLLLIVPAHAQTVAAPPGFDPHLITDVYATALAFMAPRTLEPVPVSQLTIWGLRGLTALDPELTTELRDGKLRLAARDRELVALPPPAEGDVNGWAGAATELALAAAGTSLPVRRAGTQGVVQSFFDELFNHLDPYSRYVAPRDAGEDRERRVGQAGAGLRLARRGSAIAVVEAIADGPGALAGIRPGDIIVSVDGRSTQGKDPATVMSWIAGPEETRLTIAWRGRDGRQRSAELERAVVPPETVFALRSGEALVIQVTAFNYSTDSHLAQAIEQGLAGPHPPEGIALDLRGNRGGLLRQAVTVADTLLPAGVVAITAGRDPEATRVWRSTSGELAEDIPIVVMVDGRTASAAEILAAALADRGRGVVIGSSTLGKGLVQTIAPLPDGGELYVTWSRVLAPLGWPIQGLGVLPQICTSLGQDALSWQLAALAQGRQPMAKALEAHRTARAPLPPAQILAIRNTCPAAEGRESDVDTARLLIHDPAAYAAALLPPLSSNGQVSTVGGQAASR